MKVEGFNPHYGQAKVIDGFVKTNHKWGIVSTGRQYGKSLLAMNAMLYWLLNNNKSKGCWISPIYKQCKKVFDELAEITGPVIKSSNKADLIIEFVNGSSLQFLSADSPDSIRGFSFNYMVVDEAAFIQQSAFEQAILPTLTAIGKKCLLISTPKGKNWFYNWFLKGTNGDTDFVSFKGISEDNPFADASFIVECKKSMPASVFAQEFLAEFTDDGNDVFTNLDNVCIINEYQLARPSISYYAGIDTGFNSDYSVLVILDESGRTANVSRINGLPLESIVSRFEQTLQPYRCRNIYIETNGIGEAMFQLMKNKVANVKPFVMTNESKQQGIQQLILGIQEQTFEFPSKQLMPEFYDEFAAFTYKQLGTGRLQFGAPNGTHDDIVIATMLANEARRKLHMKKPIYIGKYA
jgi:hypothetical protein